MLNDINPNFFFHKLPSYLIVLIPFFLITGPFFSDLSLSIVAIIFIINSFKNNLIKYYNNFYFKFFVIFFLILLISSILSNNVLVSLKTSFFYFRFGFFSLGFWYLIEKNNNILKHLFFSILSCFFILIVDGYFQYISGKNFFGIELHNQYRVSSFFGKELILGSYLSRLFPILFGLFVFLDQIKKNKFMLFIVTLVFILSEGLIFLSGERLALFFMNLSAIYIILMIKKYKIYRLITYIVSITLIIALLNLFPNAKNRLIDQTIYDFTRNSPDKFYIFSKPHTDMYITAYRIFLDNKFFGVGPRQYRNECSKYPVSEYSCETHPHNTYMEIMSEVGILGFLMIAFLFLLIFFQSIKHLVYKIYKKKTLISDFQICMYSSVLISLWPFSPSGSFFNNWMSIVYYFPVGIILWNINLKKNNFL